LLENEFITVFKGIFAYKRTIFITGQKALQQNKVYYAGAVATHSATTLAESSSIDVACGGMGQIEHSTKGLVVLDKTAHLNSREQI